MLLRRIWHRVSLNLAETERAPRISHSMYGLQNYYTAGTVFMLLYPYVQNLLLTKDRQSSPTGIKPLG